MRRTSRLAAVLATIVAALLAFAGSAAAATINVDIRTDEFDNDGECSLREAVQSANVDGVAQQEVGCEAGTGNDTVRLTAGTPYTLTTAIDGTPGINDGDLEVTDADGTTFLGDGRDTTQVDGGDQDRILEISAASGAVTITGLTIRNGTTNPGSGGGISTGADLTLQSSRVTENATLSSGSGGGISASGANTLVTLTDSTVDLNDSIQAGGGVNLIAGAALTASGDSHIDENDAASQGGGINASNGAVDITLGPGTTANDNDAVFGGAGIGHNTGDPNAEITITGAVLNGNEVAQGGGMEARGAAIRFFGQGSVEVTDARIQNNQVQARQAGGAAIAATMTGANPLEITRTLLSGNVATVDNDGDDGQTFGGGAVFVSDGASGNGLATITDSRISGNTLAVNDPQDHAVGGGILANGELTAISSTFDSNAVQGTPISGQGGAIGVNVPAGPTRVLNSTFNANVVATATPTGGGLWLNTMAQPATVAHGTFFANDAATGDSLTFVGTSYTVRGSVFADGPIACIPNTLPNNTANPGFSVDAGDSCVGVTDDADLEHTLALLGSLTENGGPLYGLAGPALTRALLGPAAAIDLVPPADCDDLAGGDLLVDQRGAPRPTGAGCEPGAYEIVPCEGVDAFVGTGGADSIAAASFPAHESFDGLGGADTLTGDGDANRLCGGDGNDDLTGGGGADRLSGGADNDDIFARDGIGDTISCSAGVDFVESDEQGVDTIAADCETVDFVGTPPDDGGGGGDAGGGGADVVQAPSPSPESADCEPLRQKIKRLTKKIKKADGRKQKSKLKKKRSKARRQLRELGCAT